MAATTGYWTAAENVWRLSKVQVIFSWPCKMRTFQCDLDIKGDWYLLRILDEGGVDHMWGKLGGPHSKVWLLPTRWPRHVWDFSGFHRDKPPTSRSFPAYKSASVGAPNPMITWKGPIIKLFDWKCVRFFLFFGKTES